MLFLGTSFAKGQDVADAAHQEQARKAAAKLRPKHVYTDDDLSHGKILTPEDQARVVAPKRQEGEPTAEANAPAPKPLEATAPTESLGEVARRYRQEHAARDAREAAKTSYPPFRYDVPQPANARARVSPFQPRHLESARPAAALCVTPSTRAMLVASPPATPSVPPAPQHPAQSTSPSITVQKGDTWWKLAAVYMGSGSRWTELRAFNPDAVGPGELLRSGARVSLPGEKTLVDSASRTRGVRELRIKRGDTLWTLAREHLGNANAWTCLATANPQIQDYRRMTVGTVLQMPSPGTIGSCGVSGEGLRK